MRELLLALQVQRPAAHWATHKNQLQEYFTTISCVCQVVNTIYRYLFLFFSTYCIVGINRQGVLRCPLAAVII